MRYQSNWLDGDNDGRDMHENHITHGHTGMTSFLNILVITNSIITNCHSPTQPQLELGVTK